MGGDEEMMETEQEGVPRLGGGPGETINLRGGFCKSVGRGGAGVSRGLGRGRRGSKGSVAERGEGRGYVGGKGIGRGGSRGSGEGRRGDRETPVASKGQTRINRIYKSEKKRKFYKGAQGNEAMMKKLEERKNFFLKSEKLKWLWDIPLFSLDDRIQDKLEEYNGLNICNMLYFLEKCCRVFIRNDTVSTVLQKLDVYTLGEKNNSPAGKEHLWKTLMKNLPPPTLEDSLTSCKLYLLKDFRGRKLTKNGPRTFATSISRILGDEVKSVLGEFRFNAEKLIKLLPVSGRSVINHRRSEEFKECIIEVAAYLKKSPNKFGLEETVVE